MPTTVVASMKCCQLISCQPQHPLGNAVYITASHIAAWFTQRDQATHSTGNVYIVNFVMSLAALAVVH